MARKKTVKHHKKKIQTRKNIFILIFSVFVIGIFLFSRLNHPHGNVLAIQMMPAQQVTPTPTPTTSTPTPTPTSTVTAAPTPTSTPPSSGGALQFITPTPTPSLRELPPQPVISATGQPLPSVITATPTPTPSAPSAPIQGYGFYEGCDPYLGQQCLDRLSQMASSGFKLVLNYGQLSGSAQDITNYLNTANSLGMKVIFAMSNHILWDDTNLFTYYSGLAKTCKTASGATCTTNKDLLTYMVTLVKNNPGLWGYYVGDELEQYYTKEQNFFATWSAYSNFIHSLDPNHPRLVIEGTRTGSFANPYIATFAPYTEVIGQDYYPIGDSSVVPYTQTGAVAKSVQSLVNSTNRKSAFALQLFSEQEYYPPARCTPWPSCAPLPNKAQLQKMVYDTLNNSNPQFILFYSYFDLWDSRKYSMIANDFETQQQHWDDLVSVVKATIPAGLPGGKTTPNSLFKGITDFLTGQQQTVPQTTQMPSALSVILSPLQFLSSFIFALFGGK